MFTSLATHCTSYAREYSLYGDTMFYIHLNGDDVYMSKSEEPRGTVVAETPSYVTALRQLSFYQCYLEPIEPEVPYIYPEDDESWFA